MSEKADVCGLDPDDIVRIGIELNIVPRRYKQLRERRQIGEGE